MKKEYDFSNATRAKFYRPTAKIQLPVYLDDDVGVELRRRATAKGKAVQELVNELLRHDLALVRAAE